MLWPIDGDDLDGTRDWPEDASDYDYPTEYKEPVPLTDKQIRENACRGYQAEIRMRKEELMRYRIYLEKA